MKDIRCVISDNNGRPMVWAVYPAETAEKDFERFKKFAPVKCRLVKPEELGIEEKQSIEEQLERLIGYSVSSSGVEKDGNKIIVSIEWGDWKHDHLHAKNIVETAYGDELKFDYDYITQDDGSDCYSADYVYELKDLSKEELER